MAGRPPLDPFVDFAPVARLTIDHWLIVASPALGVATLAEFVAAARARPQGLNYADPRRRHLAAHPGRARAPPPRRRGDGASPTAATPSPT